MSLVAGGRGRWQAAKPVCKTEAVSGLLLLFQRGINPGYYQGISVGKHQTVHLAGYHLAARCHERKCDSLVAPAFSNQVIGSISRHINAKDE